MSLWRVLQIIGGTITGTVGFSIMATAALVPIGSTEGLALLMLGFVLMVLGIIWIGGE